MSGSSFTQQLSLADTFRKYRQAIEETEIDRAESTETRPLLWGRDRERADPETSREHRPQPNSTAGAEEEQQPLHERDETLATWFIRTWLPPTDADSPGSSVETCLYVTCFPVLVFVLALLPMLPFWILAAFLIRLIW
jgi:hypothetical protein